MPPVLDAAAATDIGVDVSAPVAAWQAWIDAPDTPIDLAAPLESVCLQVQDATDTVRAAAATRRRRLADQWRPMAESLAEALPVADQGLSAAQRVTPLRSAENWLKRCEATIRDERFDSVKAQVADVWETLAVGSNVTLEDVRLGNKKVVMDVTVDGDSSVALGVMSQGELHALALSLFIPRVKFEASPFGFAILDDPVQAMDPVRVDGLARVLHSLAQTRQVVVFTHDDRLPTAVRRLQIPATILLVTRRPKSLVELKASLDPLQAAIEDARAVDLSGGRCVQWVGGLPETEQVSLPDPAAVAARWWREGFSNLHVVDLDAALGRGDNRALVRELIAGTEAVTQFGGGVRDREGILQLVCNPDEPEVFAAAEAARRATLVARPTENG